MRPILVKMASTCCPSTSGTSVSTSTAAGASASALSGPSDDVISSGKLRNGSAITPTRNYFVA